METPDPYLILDVPRTAEENEIRAAYRRLAVERHPDKNPEDPSATECFQNLHSAYNTLIDPVKRREYDLRNPGYANTNTNISDLALEDLQGEQPLSHQLRHLIWKKQQLEQKLNFHLAELQLYFERLEALRTGEGAGPRSAVLRHTNSNISTHSVIVDDTKFEIRGLERSIQALRERLACITEFGEK